MPRTLRLPRLKPALQSVLRRCRRQGSRPLSWQVYADDVLVGELSSEELQQLQKQVRRDWRNYVRQAAALVQYALGICSQVVLLTPLMWFWLLALAGLLHQQDITYLVFRISANPELLVDALMTSVGSALTATVVLLVLRELLEAWLLPGDHPRLQNAFSEDLRRRLRMRFRLTAGNQFKMVRQRHVTRAETAPQANDQHGREIEQDATRVG